MAEYKDHMLETYLSSDWIVSAEVDALWYRAILNKSMSMWGLMDFDIVIQRDVNRKAEGLRFFWTIKAKSRKQARKRADDLLFSLFY